MAERFTRPAGSSTAAATPHALKSSVSDPSWAGISCLFRQTAVKRLCCKSLPRLNLSVGRNRATSGTPAKGEAIVQRLRKNPFPEGGTMFATPVRVLVVGLANGNTQGMLERWRRSGWGSHTVDSVREAETVLKTIRFKVVLASENVSDGSGYELADLVGRQSGNLFISVALSETCLWLPVVEQGARSLGKRAINPWILETEVESILRGIDSNPVVGFSGSVLGRLSATPVMRGNGIPMKAGTRRDDIGLLSSSSSRESSSFGENAGAKRELPPRRRATTIHGGDRGIDTPAPREIERGSGMHGKRRVE